MHKVTQSYKTELHFILFILIFTQHPDFYRIGAVKAKLSHKHNIPALILCFCCNNLKCGEKIYVGAAAICFLGEEKVVSDGS